MTYKQILNNLRLMSETQLNEKAVVYSFIEDEFLDITMMNQTTPDDTDSNLPIGHTVFSTE